VANVDEHARLPAAVAPPEEKTLTDRVTDIRTVLAALGLLLYGVLRVTYSRFYGELGLAPDDLGLGYIELLVQSAVGAVGLLIAYTVIAAVAVPLFVGIAYRQVEDLKAAFPLYFLVALPGLSVIPMVDSLVTALLARLAEHDRVRRLADVMGVTPEQLQRSLAALQSQQERRQRRATLRRFIFALLIFPVGVLALLAALGAYGWDTFAVIALIGVAVYVLIVVVAAVTEAVSVGTRWIRRGLRGHVTVGGQNAQPWFRAGVVLVIALVVAGSATTLLLAAARDARAVRSGNAARFEILGVRITSWGADEARLSWTTDKIDAALKPLSNQCLLYLGQANQTIFVRSEGGGTFRVPAGVASIRIGAC
jgi:hypothetical protein